MIKLEVNHAMACVLAVGLRRYLETDAYFQPPFDTQGNPGRLANANDARRLLDRLNKLIDASERNGACCRNPVS